jgi:hypothetical protein
MNFARATPFPRRLFSAKFAPFIHAIRVIPSTRSPGHPGRAKPGIHETASNVRYRRMNDIRTRVVVGADHRISGTAPEKVPAGEHDVIITLSPRLAQEQTVPMPLDPNGLPRHDLGPWPIGLSLCREDIYDDDGQ